MFGRRQLEIEWNDHSAAVKHRISGNQPFRLIAHDNRHAIARTELAIFERPRQRQGKILEIEVSEPCLFAVAIGFNQTGFVRPAIQSSAQGRAKRGIFVKIQHERII